MTPKEQIADLIRMAHEAFYNEFEPGRMYSEFVAEFLMEHGVVLKGESNV